VNPASLVALLQHSAPSGGGGGEHGDPFEHLLPHVVPQPAGYHLFGLEVHNIQLFQVLAVVLVFAAFVGVPRAVRTNGGGFLARSFAGAFLWLRDTVVYPNLGEKAGRRLLPYFVSLFFFITFMNLLGLVPGGATATASAFVTGALASCTLAMMVFGGMLVQGPLTFWKNLVPPGVPGWMAPVLFFLEFIGLLVKPFALTLRLMGNMTGGHLALLSFLGLMLYFGQSSVAVGFAVSPFVVALSAFMMLIEGFVALLQAYVFVILSAIFVGMCLHPHH